MEPLQLDPSNISDQSRRTSLSLSGAGHFHLAGKKEIRHIRVYGAQLIKVFFLQVAQFYPAETSDFPSHLSTLLLESYGSLSPDIRHSLIQNLVMLRNKGVITSFE
jgi:protein SDA1